MNCLLALLLVLSTLALASDPTPSFDLLLSSNPALSSDPALSSVSPNTAAWSVRSAPLLSHNEPASPDADSTPSSPISFSRRIDPRVKEERNAYLETLKELTELQRYRYSDYRDEFYQALLSQLIDLELHVNVIIHALHKFGESRNGQDDFTVDDEDLLKLRTFLELPEDADPIMDSALLQATCTCLHKNGLRTEMRSYVDDNEMDKLIEAVLSKGNINRPALRNAIRQARMDVKAKRLALQTNYFLERYQQEFNIKQIDSTLEAALRRRISDSYRKRLERVKRQMKGVFKGNPLNLDGSHNYRYYEELKKLLGHSFDGLLPKQNDAQRAMFNEFSWAEVLEVRRFDGDAMMIEQLWEHNAGSLENTRNAVLLARRTLDLENAATTQRLLALRSIVKKFDFEMTRFRQLLDNMVSYRNIDVLKILLENAPAEELDHAVMAAASAASNNFQAKRPGLRLAQLVFLARVLENERATHPVIDRTLKLALYRKATAVLQIFRDSGKVTDQVGLSRIEEVLAEES